MTERLTVILIENSFLIQSGIEQLLQEFPELELTEVFDGSEKKLDQKIIGKKPDFLILNPEVVKDDLVSFVNRLIKFDICLIGLTDVDTPINIVSKFKCTLKLDAGKYELLEELKKITGNRTSGKIKKESQFELSDRELTILKQVVIGLTNQEIADKLYLSIHTITTHRKNITRKLGIKTVSGLTVYALMNRIVDLNDMKQR